MQQYLKLEGTNYHLEWVKVPGTHLLASHFCSLVSEKKIFEISANQSILLALAAMLNIRLERKTETL
jgi:hypothetical protein